MGENKQELALFDRALLKVSGVSHVESFDAENIYLITAQGDLLIKGEDMNIAQLDLESGDIAIRGVIDSMEYKVSKDLRSVGEKSKSFIKRLVK